MLRDLGFASLTNCALAWGRCRRPVLRARKCDWVNSRARTNTPGCCIPPNGLTAVSRGGERYNRNQADFVGRPSTSITQGTPISHLFCFKGHLGVSWCFSRLVEVQMNIGFGAQETAMWPGALVRYTGNRNKPRKPLRLEY